MQGGRLSPHSLTRKKCDMAEAEGLGQEIEFCNLCKKGVGLSSIVSTQDGGTEIQPFSVCPQSDTVICVLCATKLPEPILTVSMSYFYVLCGDCDTEERRAEHIASHLLLPSGDALSGSALWRRAADCPELFPHMHPQGVPCGDTCDLVVVDSGGSSESDDEGQ